MTTQVLITNHGAYPVRIKRHEGERIMAPTLELPATEHVTVTLWGGVSVTIEEILPTQPAAAGSE